MTFLLKRTKRNYGFFISGNGCLTKRSVPSLILAGVYGCDFAGQVGLFTWIVGAG
jgi:hypothetical protein